ncbi:flagellar assembly protein FliH [Anoxybacillus rupiensis]|jgi:flagellar assembly protein FliH|uniref:Flagellar assembly protein FliH n=1 Tax=Anoxybacteroides rupiense TaxID=311460 RepID=A0ABT5W1B3_9BACL|nr:MULTISPECIES: flagellar assembly protein FliH [Anoxybacillus]MDE8563117.1 flagellar assembly protein FliH [Anoxybacillus rupiensis]QHC03680.1 flagellar assembly protein FliH [Anoxybacillus sp. PDR2]
MILLSNVIKAPFTTTSHGSKKVIEVKHYFPQPAVSAVSQEIDGHAHAQFIIEQAKEEAKLMKQEAEQYCQSLKENIWQEKENWLAEKQRLMAAAQQEGYEAGYSQGKNEALHAFQELMNEARNIVQTTNQQFYEQIESSKETILLIGLKVAERILGEKLAENHDSFLHLVQRAIKEVREQSEVKLYVHPLHYQTLVQQKDELRAIFSQPVDIFIYPDERLAEGGCMIETPFGRIDASVDTQLQQIKQKLLKWLEEE